VPRASTSTRPTPASRSPQPLSCRACAGPKTCWESCCPPSTLARLCSSRTGPYTTRTVEPWGVVTDRGRWYLVGHDRDRDATRTFRLSRIGADVTPFGPPGAVKPPDGINLREIVDRAVGEWPTTGEARVWVADGRATALRRRATVVGPLTLGGREGEEITVDIGMLDRLAREIAGYGPDAVALEPQSLRDDVLARLRAQAGEVPA
jgi:proteasome accessory factor B